MEVSPKIIAQVRERKPTAKGLKASFSFFSRSCFALASASSLAFFSAASLAAAAAAAYGAL
jgi:hypothetical protein